MLFLVVAGVCGVMAESKVYVNDFAINPGEERVVAVNFDNGDEIANMQMDFTLPEGLEFVKYTNNEDRIERGVHNSYVTPQADYNKYRITVFAGADDVIPGNGELIYLTLRATERFKKRADILFDNIHLSDSKVPVTRVDLDPFKVSVSTKIGNIATGETAFAMRQDSTHTIEVYMTNTVDIYGIEGRITLPAGMTFAKNAKGKLDIKYGERLPLDAVVNVNEETGKFVVSALSGQTFGTDGMVFSFSVAASPELAETSQITIGEVLVSDDDSDAYTIEDVITIDVTNSFITALTPAMAIVDGLRTQLDEAVATIAETCPDVKDSEATTTAVSGIQSQIDALEEAIKNAYADETLVANYETVIAPAADIESAIETLLSDAAEAQKAYEEEQARIAANEAAYAKLTEEIAALQTKFDEAKATVETECKDVADKFAEAEQAIQSMIGALSDDVKTKYDAIELTAESTIDATEIEAAIEKLLADAAAAQKEYEETVGIESILNTTGMEYKIYTVSGKQVLSPVSGTVNVIRFSDGTVKKIYVK